MKSPPRVFTSLDEVRDAVGQVVGVSLFVTITQDIVDTFARITRDYEWLHVDPERARSGPFGGTIAHGYLTLALAGGFAADVFRLEIDAATLNYGLDRVRFPGPLPTGSSVRATVSFVSVEDHPAGHLLRVRYVMEAEGSSRPVCVADALVLVLAGAAAIG